MESKTLAAVLVVILCILLFPVFIGIVGGAFGVIGGVLGAIFGLIGGIFGAVAGVIGSVFGAIFSVIGWVLGWHHHWNHSFDFFDRDVFAGLVVVFVVLMIARSRKTQTRDTKP